MRSREEGGSALVELVCLALLLLVPLLYVLLAVFETQRAAYAASAAARSASRAFVGAEDVATARARARVAAELAFADQGLPGTGFDLRISCRPVPDRCLSPGSVVTVVIGTQAALPLAPPVFAGSVPAITVQAEHRSPYGTFREAR